MDLLVIILSIISTGYGEEEKCPGRYCGRTLLDGKVSDCGACPRGFRSDGLNCVKCVDNPEFYDWLYLLFMVLVALLLHLFFIDLISAKKRFSKQVLVLHISALIEVLIASLCTLLLMEPMGSLQIISCRNNHLSDWYTLLHNPNPNYEAVLHCTQEAVYPLYSMIFIFYAFATLAMLLIRPWLTNHFRFGPMTIYAGLYFYPILSLLHAVFCGIIYYTYPYVVIVGSLISSATHFAYKEQQSVKALVLSCVTNVRDAVILVGHWLLHAFGIIAVTELKDSHFHYALVALVPLPTIFYILTAKFTDPIKYHVD